MTGSYLSQTYLRKSWARAQDRNTYGAPRSAISVVLYGILEKVVAKYIEMRYSISIKGSLASI